MFLEVTLSAAKRDHTMKARPKKFVHEARRPAPDRLPLLAPPRGVVETLKTELNSRQVFSAFRRIRGGAARVRRNGSVEADRFKKSVETPRFGP